MSLLTSTSVNWDDLARQAAAVTAQRLGQFLDVPVTLSTVEVSVQTICGPGVKDKNAQLPIIGSVINTTDPAGCILFAMPESSAKNLVRVAYQGLPDPPRAWDERGQSAVTETANIIAGAFLSELNTRMNLAIQFGTPGFVHDMLGAVLNELTVVTSTQADAVIWLQMQLCCKQRNINAQLCFVAT